MYLRYWPALTVALDCGAQPRDRKSQYRVDCIAAQRDRHYQKVQIERVLQNSNLSAPKIARKLLMAFLGIPTPEKRIKFFFIHCL